MCMRCDAIVRSIQIGTTLNARFGALMKRKFFEGRYSGVLAAGEAEQIYPAIWGHFDSARAALAEIGIDMDVYDEYRQRTGPFAIVGAERRGRY